MYLLASLFSQRRVDEGPQPVPWPAPPVIDTTNWLVWLFVLIPVTHWWLMKFYLLFRIGYKVVKIFVTRWRESDTESEVLYDGDQRQEARRRVRLRKEAVQKGSQYYTAPPAKCQVVVWTAGGDGKWEPNCSGWRKGEYLYTAAHGIISDNIGLSRSVDGDDEIYQVSTKNMAVVDDCARVRVPPGVWTSLQTKSAKIATVDGDYVHVSGIYGRNNASSGQLLSTSTMGVYRYTGSTDVGFSGAPYVIGDNTVVAMHMSGGTVNLATSATYLELVFRDSSEKLEARFTTNDDWYNPDDDDEGTDYKFRRSPGNPDDYLVERGGRLHVMDEEEFTRFRRHMRNKASGPKYQQRAYTRDDDRYEAKKVKPKKEAVTTEAFLDLQTTEYVTQAEPDLCIDLLQQQLKTQQLLMHYLQREESKRSKNGYYPSSPTNKKTRKPSLPRSSSTQTLDENSKSEPSSQA